MSVLNASDLLLTSMPNTPASTRVLSKQKRLDLAGNLVTNLTVSGNPQLEQLPEVKLMDVKDYKLLTTRHNSAESWGLDRIVTTRFNSADSPLSLLRRLFEARKPGCKARYDTSHTLYYSFYKRLQLNSAFSAKRKNRRANLGMIQTQNSGV